ICFVDWSVYYFFFQAEDGIRDRNVTGVQTCALPISLGAVSGLDVSPLGLDEDVGVRLSMVGALVEDDDVRTFTRGTDPDSELRSAVGWRVLVLPYKRLFDVLPNALFGGVVNELPGEEVGHLPVSDPAHGLNGRSSDRWHGVHDCFLPPDVSPVRNSTAFR